MHNIISLIDLTSLNDNDDETCIRALCEKAQTVAGNVAAVCIYPQFVALAKSLLNNTDIHVATVANFPSGDEPLDACLQTIIQAIHSGADEIDVVLPYEKLIQGNTDFVLKYLRAVRNACCNKKLKVILETGALTPNQIKQAATIAAESDVDFLKTSTGKTSVGATLEAADILLDAIKSSHKNIGIKLSGGIRSSEDAEQYIDLIKNKMGETWITQNNVRFGASRLLEDLLQKQAAHGN